MTGKIFSTLFAAAALLSSRPAFAQESIPQTEKEIRVGQLMETAPEKLVSEAPYSTVWPPLADSDISWRCRVWQNLDTRDERNKALAAIGPARKSLMSIFEAGISEGKFKVYGRGDDRFTHEINKDSTQKLIAADHAAFPGTGIVKFRIKQDWLYISTEQKLVGRIIGIAPVREVVAADGTTTEQVLFWIYYPPARPYFREQKVANGKDPSIQNPDELFENMKFSTTILTSSRSLYTRPTGPRW